MNAQETITAAIQKLEGLRDSSDDGPWTLTTDLGETIVRDAHRIPIANPGSYAIDDASFSAATGSLIVTLHRTIDAQLAILRQAHAELEPFNGVRLADDAVQHELDLARAIIGDDA